MPLKSPFGTFYVPNISPDPNDGIGKWSEADFVTAMLKGTSPDGRHYFPAFPYSRYQRMKLQDVRDLFAHIEDAAGRAGARCAITTCRSRSNVRRLVGGRKFLFLDGKPFVADTSQVRAMEPRRAIWSTGPATARSAIRRAIRSAVLSRRSASRAGRTRKAEGWVPNIPQKGLGEYSDKDIAVSARNRQYTGGRLGRRLDDGGDPQHRAASGGRPQCAMAAYLKSLPAVDGPKRPEEK